MMEKKDIGTEQKLWIFGDSFTGFYHKNDSWQWLLYEKFIGKNMKISSQSSRDVQSIIDIFLRNLYEIKSDDFVIIFLPTLSRFRLPLNKPMFDCEYDTEYRTLGKTVHYKDYSLLDKNKDFFIGSQYYSSIVFDSDPENSYKKLEFPLNYLDINKLTYGDFRKVDLNSYTLNVKDYLNNNLNFGDFTSLINSSKAQEQNINAILKSLKLYLPNNLYFVSWTDEYDINYVDSKTEIKNNIGMWHTLFDDWKETNGKEGQEGDVHWSKKMNKAFADYLIVKFPQFFNI